MSRSSSIIGPLSLAMLAFGCAAKPPTSERGVLSNVTQLTHGFPKAGEAYFSADGRWIIFQATPAGESQYQMYVAPLSGETIGTPVRISPEPSRNTCGYFSPDGRSILFASTAGQENPTEENAGYQRAGGNYKWAFSPHMEIYRADDWRAGIESATSSSATRPAVDFAKHALTHNDHYDAECVFSADGRWIIFSSDREPDAATGKPDMEVYAMRADGSHVVRLTHAAGYDGGAFLSPDGTRIVFRSDRIEKDLLQIYVADVVRDAAGEITGIANERAIAQGKDVNWCPFWHPSGDFIVYASSAQGHANYELYLIRADGTRRCRLTFTDGFDGLPAFDATGTRLMWSSKRTPDGTTQVFIADFKTPGFVKSSS